MALLPGIRVLEAGGIGSGPQAAKQLGDLGAEVLRLETPTTQPATAVALLHRGRPAASLDLRSAGALELLLELVTRADVLIEDHLPGVAERLGSAPKVAALQTSHSLAQD